MLAGEKVKLRKLYKKKDYQDKQKVMEKLVQELLGGCKKPLRIKITKIDLAHLVLEVASKQLYKRKSVLVYALFKEIKG